MKSSDLRNSYNPERLRNANFHFTVQPLDAQQIQIFIDQWYDLALGADPDKARLKRRLQTAIDQLPRFKLLSYL